MLQGAGGVSCATQSHARDAVSSGIDNAGGEKSQLNIPGFLATGRGKTSDGSAMYARHQVRILSPWSGAILFLPALYLFIALAHPVLVHSNARLRHAVSLFRKREVTLGRAFERKGTSTLHACHQPLVPSGGSVLVC